MTVTPFVRILLILIALASNISCDQVSKNLVRERIADDQRLSFVNDRVTLTRIENSGAFLSLGHTLPKPVKFLVLTILPLMIIGFSIAFLFTKNNLGNKTTLGICFVAGGGTGNIYDRLMYGSVTDFLHIDFGIFQTGIFNMADVSIMVGMFLILLDNFAGLPWLKTSRVK